MSSEQSSTVMGGISALPAAAASAASAVLDKALDAVGLNGTEGEESKKDEEKAKDGEEKEEGEVTQDDIAEGAETQPKKEVRTVFDDPEDPTVKHPLYSNWTLYYSSPQMKSLPKTPAASGNPQAGGWMQDIKEVVKFNSVEEFWGLYNNIIGPSLLGARADYYLFKDDIIPAWEDPANKHGGKWSVQFPRDKTRNQIDAMWLNTMLAAIGETYEVDPEADSTEVPDDEKDLLTGVIINIRPNFFRLNIWTRTAPSDPTVESSLKKRIETIGKHFKTTVLSVPTDQKILPTGGNYSTELEFASHKDSEKKGNTKKIVI